MKRGRFSLIFIVCGILCLSSASWAQTESRWEQVASSGEANSPVVRVYGPDVLTDLAERAIQERRPDVAIVKYHESLKNKVRIEGTTGSGYMQLSPKRVNIVQAAVARGGSAYSALCNEQKGVIQRTVGTEKVTRRVERKEYRRRVYVQTVCPPSPVVYVAPVSVGYAFGGYYPFLGYTGYAGYRGYAGYGGYGAWRGGHHGYYRGGMGYHSSHQGGHHSSGAFHRGHR